MRHCLDHFDALQLGIQNGTINYDHRARDPRTETEPEIALNRIGSTIIWLREASSQSDLQLQVQTMTCARPSENRNVIVQSSLGRELAFVIQHLTHHLGIIRILVTLLGVNVHEDLGKAVSTLDFESRKNNPSPQVRHLT